MNNIIEVLVLLFAVAAWFFFKSSGGKAASKFPPGPYPLPIFGNIFQLGRNPHHRLANLSKTYGPLMSLQLGNLRTFVVSSPQIAQEILQKHDLAFPARLDSAVAQAHGHSSLSIICLPIGKEWRKLRRICKEQLFSSTRLDATQGLRRDSLQKLCGYVQSCGDSGREVDIGQAAFVTLLNLMSVTLFSVELTSLDSDTKQEWKETVNGITKLLGAPNIADYFPVFAPFDPQRLKRRMEHYFGKLLEASDDIIKQRLKSRGSSLSYRKENDFLEALLDLGEDELTIKQIKHLFMDLTIGGSDSVPSTVEWAMTELLLNPDKYKKAKQELQTVIEETKAVQESDVARLPYLQAVIKEVFRLHPTAPLLVPHKADRDVEIGGYIIPKGTSVVFNLWAMGRDPNLWADPNSFEPERFLEGKSMDFRGQDFGLFPFGSGRRICPGLPLAERMLCCMTATLVHNFNWEFEVNEKTARVHREETFGIALHKRVPLTAVPIKSQRYHSCAV